MRININPATKESFNRTINEVSKSYACYCLLKKGLPPNYVDMFFSQNYKDSSSLCLKLFFTSVKNNFKKITDYLRR